MFIPTKTLTEGVLPVSAQENVATLFTTTPGADNCYLMKIMQKLDANGLPKLPILRFGNPCADCSLTDTPWRCMHNVGELPHWKSKDKLDQFAFLWEDYQAVNLKENFAFSVQQGQYGFRSEDVRALELSLALNLTYRPAYVTLTADAAAGGTCEFAISAGYMTEGGHFVILLMDSATVKDANITLMQTRLRSAIERIRNIDILKDIPILFIPENGPGPMGSLLSYLIRDVPGVLTMRESGPDRKPGVLKTNKSTMEMALMSIEALRMGRIHYSNMILGGMTPAESSQGLKMKLHQQMRDYQLEIRHDPENPFAEPKYAWRGLSNDDLLISVMMHIYWDDFFWKASGRPEYDVFKRSLRERAVL